MEAITREINTEQQHDLEFFIDLEGQPQDSLRLTRFTWKETLSQLYFGSATLASRDPDIKLNDCIDRKVLLTLSSKYDARPRYLSGITLQGKTINLNSGDSPGTGFPVQANTTVTAMQATSGSISALAEPAPAQQAALEVDTGPVSFTPNPPPPSTLSDAVQQAANLGLPSVALSSKPPPICIIQALAPSETDQGAKQRLAALGYRSFDDSGSNAYISALGSAEVNWLQGDNPLEASGTLTEPTTSRIKGLLP